MNSLGIDAQLAANITAIKSVNKNFATVGDTLIYTLSITNNGTSDALNLIVTDLVPQGANFITNTVKINGVVQNGVNPALGINVGTIPVGNSTTVVLEAEVITLPYTITLTNYGQVDYQYIDLTTTPSTITASIDSNSVVTTINVAIIELLKVSTTTVVTSIGQTIRYDIRMSNVGDVPANNVVFLDTIPTGTTFIQGSLVALGVTLANGTVAPPGGLSLPSFPANTFGTITFQVQVNTIPSNNTITNQAMSTYTYVINPVGPITVNGASVSNVLSFPASQSLADLRGITKRVNTSFASSNDILTYTITIPNSGNITAINVVLSDTIPNGTTYVANSLTLNGIPSPDMPSHINIGTISAGTIVTVQFQVEVD